MQLWGVSRAGRAGKFAGGCALLFAACAPSSASAQAISSGVLSSGAFAQAGATVDTRDFAVIPVVGLQESFTDNALLTSTGKQYDFITRPMVGADMNIRGPLTATVSGDIFYDAYARDGRLSGWSGDGSMVGTYDLVPSFLSIDAQGVLTNTNATVFGQPAIDRVGTADRTQLATYDIGPHVKTTLDDFADVDLIGRFAQIFFTNPNASTVVLPTDSTVVQSVGTIDTAQRYAGYELVTSGQFERDDHGFQSYGGLQSVFLQVMPEVRLIGRGGYDHVEQPIINTIDAPIWSGGVEVSINQQSKITVETGERYNHSAWAADLHLQFLDQLYAVGRYFETLEPDQVQINSSFVDFVTQTIQLPVQLASGTFNVNGNLDSQVSLNKEAEFHLVYDWQGQTIDLQTSWSDRLFMSANEHDRTLLSGVSYRRTIAPDLALTADAAYWHTFANPFYGASELYRGEAALQYDLNPTMRLTGGYTYERQLQLFAGGEGITENVLYATITKRF